MFRQGWSSQAGIGRAEGDEAAEKEKRKVKRKKAEAEA